MFLVLGSKFYKVWSFSFVMIESDFYVLLGILVLIVLLGFLYFGRKDSRKEGFSSLAGVAFAFVVFGIAFDDDRLLSYGMMGVGVLLAVVDIFLKRRKK